MKTKFKVGDIVKDLQYLDYGKVIKIKKKSRKIIAKFAEHPDLTSEGTFNLDGTCPDGGAGIALATKLEKALL